MPSTGATITVESAPTYTPVSIEHQSEKTGADVSSTETQVAMYVGWS